MEVNKNLELLKNEYYCMMGMDFKSMSAKEKSHTMEFLQGIRKLAEMEYNEENKDIDIYFPEVDFMDTSDVLAAIKEKRKMEQRGIEDFIDYKKAHYKASESVINQFKELENELKVAFNGLEDEKVSNFNTYIKEEDIIYIMKKYYNSRSSIHSKTLEDLLEEGRLLFTYPTDDSCESYGYSLFNPFTKEPIVVIQAEEPFLMSITGPHEIEHVLEIRENVYNNKDFSHFYWDAIYRNPLGEVKPIIAEKKMRRFLKEEKIEKPFYHEIAADDILYYANKIMLMASTPDEVLREKHYIDKNSIKEFHPMDLINAQNHMYGEIFANYALLNNNKMSKCLQKGTACFKDCLTITEESVDCSLRYLTKQIRKN